MERGVFRGSLEEKQCAVFKQVLDGKHSREIAQILQISVKDVDGIIRKTCQQLGAKNRKDAARAMAAHYRWNTQHNVSHQIPRASSGVVSVDRNNDGRGLHDVGSLNADQRVKMTNSIDLPELFGALLNAVTSSYFKRTLLFVVLVVGSSIALGALVSAMQGFNMLVSSWS
jgi:DNA-binding CsgD family transcriptional regulator